ncbi:hypothetical protein HQ544_00695 [Candidatus Falkowbacteria bacterium]|nr:hypothetical protein [Candidatus Falkowbacteria bacterium]
MTALKKFFRYFSCAFLFALTPIIAKANVIAPRVMTMEDTIYDIIKVIVVVIVISLIESPFIFFLFKKKFSYRYSLLIALLANVISTLFGFWLFLFKLDFNQLRLFTYTYLLSGLIEGGVMYMFFRKKFGFARIILMSYLVNLVSYLLIAGLLLILLYVPFFSFLIINL